MPEIPTPYVHWKSNKSEIIADKNLNQEDAECEGCEASVEEVYQFNQHKSSDLRGEVDGNLINNNQKEVVISRVSNYLSTEA